MRCGIIVVAACVVLCLTAGLTDGEGTRGTRSQPDSALIRPGEVWLDTAGEPINAHGGGFLFHEGVYYWYGEHKSSHHRSEVGIRVYRSTDLVRWENAGVALAVSDDPMSEIVRGAVMERPKVLYNARTGRFVMWFHLELKGHRYNAARTACAVADSPTGPFEYIGSVRPNAGRFPMDASASMRDRVIAKDASVESGAGKPERADSYFVRDFYGGQMARDMTLFLDHDGTAYHIFASEENYTLHIAELDETFTRHTGRYKRVLVGGHREAPAIFKRGDTYHMITSGCTGWKPNAAGHAWAPTIWGPWTTTGNPCVGPEREVTFRSQSTYVLPVVGVDDGYVFMADRWKPKALADSRYIWLPLRFEEGRPVLEMVESWSPATAWAGR